MLAIAVYSVLMAQLNARQFKLLKNVADDLSRIFTEAKPSEVII